MVLGTLDIAVLAAFFVAVAGVGIWFGRHERSTEDFFLGGRRQHWLAVGLSIIATEVSALTFIGVPADSFKGDFSYLQLYVGSFIGRMLIVFLLLPAFYGGSVTTVYEYLGQRFGPATRVTASLMFFASRIIGSGLRLLVASLAISVVFGWPLTWVVIGAAVVAIAYTAFGGIKAIIWTDALQALVFVGGGVAAAVCLFIATPGGWTANLQTAYEAGKFDTFTFTGGLNNDKLFWVLTLYAIFTTMAALGTDQDLTQRMLTCPDLRRGQRSLIFNALVGLPVVCLFLLIGALMYVYYQQPGLEVPPEILAKKDRVFPYFIATAVPTGVGLKGLLIAGIFAAAMSSLDSALGALSSTAVTDFYRPYIVREASETHYVRVARGLVVAFGALLAAVALAFAGHDDLLWETFRWAGLIFGGLLGVFLLAVTTRSRGYDPVNVVAMVSSVAVLVVIKFLQEHFEVVYVGWPWWVVIGTAWTYGLGVCSRTRMRP